MPFLANTLLQASLWQYKAVGQPEIYVNFNLVAALYINRDVPVVAIYFGEEGQNLNPVGKGQIGRGVRLLETATAVQFIADLDALFAEPSCSE